MRLIPPLLGCLLLALHASPAIGEPTHSQDLQNWSFEKLTPRQLSSLGDSASGVKPAAGKGRKDAPVDGLDGKPHKGPFVEADGGPDSSSRPPSTGSVRKGRSRKSSGTDTTGTEGGVTARERDRESGGSAKVPDAPRIAPDVPEGENKAIGIKKTSSSDKVALAETEDSSTVPAKPKGAAGITKPSSLPDGPHSGPSSKDLDESESDEEDGWTADGDDDTDDHDPLPFDSFIGAFLSILVTEIGDKTFLIAALMAMRHPRLQVFTAAASALLVMTVLSALTGHAVGSLLSKRWTALIAGLLFLLFGGKSMQEGLAMSPDQGVSEEMEEVRAELEEKEEAMAQRSYDRRASSISPYALEAGRAGQRSARAGSRLPMPRSPSESPSRSLSPGRPSIASALAGVKNLLSLLLSPAWVETFAMTFIGELGDRSQIATVAMAAGQEYIWIMIGATLGHIICTGLAVLGGSALAGRVSMRKVTLIGAWVFIAFGLYTLYEAFLYFHQ